MNRAGRKRIVVIGGGTGSYTVLSGLKRYPLDLSAVVSMADDGGSTGLLRDELGVLPPGDVRQCLVALSRSDLLMRTLMNYRFQNGGLEGHTFGNLLLSSLEKVTGSFDKAVEKASEILRLDGRVIPATLDEVRLVVKLADGTQLAGEHELHEGRVPIQGKIKSIALKPKGNVNPRAARAIKSADAIIIGPGGIYSSLVPNFLVKGLGEAVCASRAAKIYVVNLMTKEGQTDGWTVRDYADAMEAWIGCRFDAVLYNTKRPTPDLLRRYAQKGEKFVEIDKTSIDGRFRGADLVSRKFPVLPKKDLLARSLIRHDSAKLARKIIAILDSLV